MKTKQNKEFNENARFMPISIYKFPLGDCGGITDHVKQIYVPCETGFVKYESIKETPELIFTEEQRGPEYWALKPIIEPVGCVGPMAGGNLAYSSDSRIKRVYHVHDRWETQAMYNSLSI